MKARIVQPSTFEGPLLTIGMIVKNEEKTLKKCLKGLKPLLDAVNGELIITDTGSTDSTVEIAKAFTDKVNYFEWCNDFAAARNYNLSFATGKWFMFVDADEIFDDTISEIINFLTSDLQEKYTFAGYIVRNYAAISRERYSDGSALRMAKRNVNTAFEGTIHEHLIVTQAPYSINAIAHHDGYIVLNTGSVKNKKDIRNRGLMLAELEKDPTDLRLYKLLADCYCTSDAEEYKAKKHYLMQGITISGDKNTYFERSALYHNLISAMLNANEYFQAKKYAQEFYEKLGEEASYTTADIHYLFGSFYYNAKMYNFAIQEISAYISTYDYCKKEKANDFEQFANVFFANSQCERVKAQALLAVCCAFMEDTENAKKHFDLSINTSTEFIDKIFTELCIVAVEIGCLDALLKLYNKAEITNKLALICAVNTTIIKYPHLRTDIINVFKDENEDNLFIALNNVRLADLNLANCDEQTITTLLESEEIYTNPQFADLFYANIIHPDERFDYFSKVTEEFIKKAVAYIVAWDKEFSDNLYTFAKKKLAKPSKKELVVLLVLIRTSFLNKNNYTFPQMLEMFEIYIAKGNEYLQATYIPEILTDENIMQLPNWQTAIYFLGNAFSQKQTSTLSYIKNLNTALKCDSGLIEQIQYLLDTLALELDKKNDISAEFEILANQVKAQLKLFIRNGNKREADEILQRYMLVNPNDSEIIELTEKIMKI